MKFKAYQQRGTMTDVSIRAPSACDGPTRVRVELQVSDHTIALNHRPIKSVYFAIRGVPVLSARATDSSNVRMTRYRGQTIVTVTDADIGGYGRSGGNLTMVFELDLARKAGFDACYVDTPDLLDYTGTSQQFSTAGDIAGLWAEHHAPEFYEGVEPFAYRAVLSTKVDRMTPDRSTLASAAVTQQNEVRLGCDGDIPDSPSGDKYDDFNAYEKIFTANGCGTLQRFHRAGSDQILNRRVFIAGTLLSLALALLLEAAVTGETERREGPSRHAATSDREPPPSGLDRRDGDA